MPLGRGTDPGPATTRITTVYLATTASLTINSMTEPTTLTLPLRAGVWEVDPLHSSVTFSIRHLGISKVRGRFANFDVSLVVGDDLDSTQLTATIDVASIDTGIRDRDNHVLAADMVDVTKRPTLVFRSHRVEHAGDDSYEVHGEVTVGVVTRPLVLAVEHTGVETSPADGRRRAGFEATTTVSRKDLGVEIALPPGMSGLLGDKINVEIDIQAFEPAE
jgi:polyisoprenoid-binding protein YceI